MTDPAGSVIVNVDGEPWQLTSSLAESDPDDRVFTVTQTPDGSTVVQFGDGLHGAQPPAGSEIGVSYRSGDGANANNVTVTLDGKIEDSGIDQVLWVAIRNQCRAISFEFSERHARSEKGLH
jgi:hypothetical protein